MTRLYLGILPTQKRERCILKLLSFNLLVYERVESHQIVNYILPTTCTNYAMQYVKGLSQEIVTKFVPFPGGKKIIGLKCHQCKDTKGKSRKD